VGPAKITGDAGATASFMRSPLTGYVPFRLRIATPGAPDDGEHTTGEFALSPVAVAVTLGVIILLACMKLGCSFDMSCPCCAVLSAQRALA